MIREVVAPLALMSTAVLSTGAPVAAQHPTLSDIVVCNEQAAAKTAPSALPGTGLQPRTRETARQGSSHDPPAALRETTDPSGAVITESPDPLVIGMDAGHAGDRAYRMAYRQCMERRTGPGR